MSLLRDMLHFVEGRLDEDLLPALYAAVSLETELVRQEFDGTQLEYANEREGRFPPMDVLDLSADEVLAGAQNRAASISATGALAGAIGVPPEVLASLVADLRLAQRLAVVYGFDPESDRGQMLLWRAIGAAYDVEVPDQAALNLRVRDLPNAAGKQLPEPKKAAAWMARRVVRRSIRMATRRVTRLIPGLTTGLSAYSAHKRTGSQGQRMKDVFRRACAAEESSTLLIEDAVEV